MQQVTSNTTLSAVHFPDTVHLAATTPTTLF